MTEAAWVTNPKCTCVRCKNGGVIPDPPALGATDFLTIVPRRMGKTVVWADLCRRRAVFIGVDPAKPDPALYRYMKQMCDDLANPVGRAEVPVQVFVLPDAKPEADRIWDLVVLAARASRYSE